jgi:hypothetical protein
MMVNESYKFSELTGKVIGCTMTVYNALQCELPEAYCHRAVVVELRYNIYLAEAKLKCLFFL